MRIFILAPPHFCSCCPDLMNSGSIEQLAFRTADSLARLGHRVTLFSCGDSSVSDIFDVDYFFPCSLENYYSKDSGSVMAREFIHGLEFLKKLPKSSEFYVINHMMSGIPILEFFKSQTGFKNFCSTIHWPLDDRRLKPFLEAYPTHPLVGESRHQKNLLSNNNFLGLAPPGIDLSLWSYSPIKKNYVLYVGKIIPEKGVDLLVRAVSEMDGELFICGRIIEERYPGYFDSKIKPFLSEKIKYLGEISGDFKYKLFAEAKVFVSPGRWAEPFGVVYLEAQACGTPIICWNPGSTNDFVVDGKTGYILRAKTDDEAIGELKGKIKLSPSLLPEACRKNVEDNFSIEKTALAYESILKNL